MDKSRNIFNNCGRIKNSAHNAVASVINQIALLLGNFIFRTVFVKVLPVEYLGINGLFSNILTLLSLAELGIGTAIVYRMYKPISDNDLDSVAALMRFFKKIYFYISFVVLVVGLCIMPALPHIIKEFDELNASINLYFIYSLFLFQTLSTYLFAYRGTLLQADQRGYINSYISAAYNVVLCILQVCVLILTKSFILSLIIGISLKILLNIVVSVVATIKYQEVFKNKAVINNQTKKLLKDDVKATMFHKIGGVILNGTDSIILSAFIGVFTLGIYSNYLLLVNAVSSIIGQIFGNFTASIGNAAVNLTEEDFYRNYHRLQFLNLLISAWAAICIISLSNPFISVWLGADMLLDEVPVFLIGINFFLSSIRNINMSFTNATGLFRKDKARPLIEAALNLGLSLLLVNFYGLSGVLIGTTISNLVTVFWREPFLLHKYIFHKSQKKYYFMLIIFTVIFLVFSIVFSIIFGHYVNSAKYVFLKFGIAIFLPALFMLSIFVKTDELRYVFSVIKKIINKYFCKGDKKDGD